MQMTPEKSFQIITEMISDTREKFHQQAFFLLLWGWIVAIAGLAHYLLAAFTTYAHPYYAWGLVVVGIIISAIYGYNIGKRKQYKSHLERIVMFVWIAFLLSYFVLIFHMEKINYQVTPLIFLLAAIATFTSGIVLKFKPLIYGALFMWVMAFAQFYLPYDYQLLSIPVTIVIGYLIPGYMLKAKK
jgi:uncharacterized membrane protein